MNNPLTTAMIALQILGVIENMSCFKCPHCGEPSFIFGKEGTRRTANEMNLDFLGEVCLLFPSIAVATRNKVRTFHYVPYSTLLFILNVSDTTRACN